MMQQSTLRRFMVATIVLAMVAMLPPSAATADESHHEGTFIRVSVGKIMILNRDQTATEIFPMSGLIKVIRNGSQASTRDLVRGDLIQLETEVRLGREFVVGILATSRP